MVDWGIRICERWGGGPIDHSADSHWQGNYKMENRDGEEDGRASQTYQRTRAWNQSRQMLRVGEAVHRKGAYFLFYLDCFF